MSESIREAVAEDLEPTPPHKKEKTMKKRRFSEGLFVYCAIALPLLQFVIFYVAVNINSIFLAFQSYDYGIGSYKFLGFENFAAFFDDIVHEPVLIISIRNSAILYACTLFIAMPLGICFSFFVYKKIPLSGFFKIILFMPSIISSIVIVLMYKYFLEWAIPSILTMCGAETSPNFFYDSTYSFGTLIFYGLWIGFGGGIILYTGAMARIPDSIIEFGQLEGMNLFQELIHITFPMIFPTITVFLVTGVADFFTNNAYAYSFYAESAPYNVYTIGYYLFVKVIGSKASLADYPYAAAAGICFTLVAAPITLLVKYLLEKFGPDPEY